MSDRRRGRRRRFGLEVAAAGVIACGIAGLACMASLARGAVSASIGPAASTSARPGPRPDSVAAATTRAAAMSLAASSAVSTEGVTDARTNAATDDRGTRSHASAPMPTRIPERAPTHTPRHTPTRVVAIYPTAPRVPENLLKIYIEFSAPMRDGEAAARVRLLDMRGRTLDGAFLQVDEELWDPSRRRLTLLLDPGRVKRGLRAHLESGAPLRAGHAVTLAIDGGWPDDAGHPLAAPARRRWEVGAADRSSPTPEHWRIDQPPAGTRAPLVVRFGEPLDRALLGRLLRVEDAQGRLVSGDARVDPAESGWRFTPAAPWSDAEYTLVVDRRIEDLAANRPSSLFDVDLTRRAIAPPRHAARQGAGLSAGAAPAAAAETNDAVRLRIRPRRAPAPAL